MIHSCSKAKKIRVPSISFVLVFVVALDPMPAEAPALVRSCKHVWSYLQMTEPEGETAGAPSAEVQPASPEPTPTLTPDSDSSIVQAHHSSRLAVNSVLRASSLASYSHGAVLGQGSISTATRSLKTELEGFGPPPLSPNPTLSQTPFKEGSHIIQHRL